MNLLKIFSVALVATTLLASCGDDKPAPEPMPDNGNYKGTVSVAPGTDSAFTLEDAEVKFTVAEDGTTAEIELLAVKFAVAMPFEIDMRIPGVGLSETGKGYSVSGDGIVPTAMEGRPFEQYTITGLTGTVTPETMSIKMMCGTYPLSFTGVRKAE
jgi:hypothetical protein